MRKTDKPNDTVVVAQQVVHGDGASTAPEAFAGMYQTGYSDGYSAGQGAGFRRGFEEGYAAAHKGPNGAAVMSAAEAAPAPKRGPRRMPLGLPCAKCGAYFASDENTASRASSSRSELLAAGMTCYCRLRGSLPGAAIRSSHW